MKIWIFIYLPAVGEEQFDSAWSSEEKADAHLAKKEVRGHWDKFETEIDGGPHS